MTRRQHFQVLATYQTAAILRAAGEAMSDLTSGGTTRAHSFARLVQHYTGKRFSLEEIQVVLDRPISSYIKQESYHESL